MVRCADLSAVARRALVEGAKSDQPGAERNGTPGSKSPIPASCRDATFTGKVYESQLTWAKSYYERKSVPI